MSRRFTSHPLLRGIFDIARKLRILTSPHRPSLASEIQTVSQVLLHLPDVRSPVQYLIDMGLRPTLARYISSVYMELVARYRQVFRSHFRRVIRGGCHQPEYYRDIFVIQFKGTIRAWESQIMSTAWIWLCRVGLPPGASHPQCIDVRVDDTAKAEILSRLGLKPTSLTGLDHGANKISQSKEECRMGRVSFTKPRPVLLAPPTLAETTSDLFRREAPSTCFPTLYPPPPSESCSSSERALVTSFARRSSIQNNEKQLANYCANMSSFISLFSRMTVTIPEVCPETRKSCKGSWIPNSKKIAPLSPVLPPIIVDISGPSNKQQSMTVSVSSTEPATAPRRRRIAPLPKRRTEAPLSTLCPSSPFPCSSSLAAVPPCKATSLTSAGSATKPAVTKNAHPDYVLMSSQTIYARSTSPVQNLATSGLSTSKSVPSRQRKIHPLPRRVHPQSQPSPRQASTYLALPEWKVPESRRTVSRTPSLVSNSSSGIDSSSSSSDELDTPPSTPSSSLQALPSKAAEEVAILPESSTMTMRGHPLIGSAKLPKSMDKGIHIDFAKGCVGHTERPLTFTFSA